MLRIAKIYLVLMVSLWALVGAFHNIASWSGTIQAVEAATSMVTFEGGAESWQATSNPVIVWGGALFIILSKLAAGILCAIGALRMWQTRASDSVIFIKSKEIALVGCAVAVAMLFGGFIVVAESWFELWKSDAMRGPVLDSAFRYGGMIALIALFVTSRDD